jgi:hypothetical protein
MHNVVSGNFIGTDASGTAALGNEQDGVRIRDGAQFNLIGGDTPGERNLISGNGEEGVDIRDSGTMNNTVSGNYIGTDASGILALGNAKGVVISGGAQSNLITGNLISGNDGGGVGISGLGTMNNTVSGNYIGTDVDGLAAMGNSPGVTILSGAQSNLIGGDNATPGGACTGECNLISGNSTTGIWIDGSSTNSNTVSGNYVGTDVSGTAPLGNQWIGITIREGQYNLIGGDTPAERNLISANGFGVGAYNPTTDHNVIKGNYIGTDAGGTADLGNLGYGIMFCLGAHDNLAENNLVAFSKYYDDYRPGPGILVLNDTSVNNTLSQNSVHSNAHKGILLSEGGNTGLPAPVITDLDLGAGTVSGTACPGCTVEIFSDSEDEGEVYEGQAIASGTGDFTFNKGAPFVGPRVTATATDSAGNTSEFGLPASVPADFDFDGDGDSDVGVYRPAAGRWFIQGQPIVTFGASDDIPTPGDYDGDGDADVALFRPSVGRWFILGQPMATYGAIDDIPVPGDYNGDGITDVAVYRPSAGRWFILGQPLITYGGPNDIPVPGDYDGDGDTEAAVFRPVVGRWFIQGQPMITFGGASDIPAPGDYDGDGDTDIALFRPSAGRWFILGMPMVTYGTSGDIPAPGDFDGDGDTDIALFRPSSGRWFILGGPMVPYGASGDIPVEKRPSYPGYPY